MIIKTDGTNPYEPGDVVQLKSGGPNMTIGRNTSIVASYVECCWYDVRGRIQREEFHHTMVNPKQIIPLVDQQPPTQTTVELHGYSYPIYK